MGVHESFAHFFAEVFLEKTAVINAIGAAQEREGAPGEVGENLGGGR